MNSVWLALIWKEWCEHRWKLAALTAIALVGPLAGLLGAEVDRAGCVMLTIMLYAPIASAFVAMGAAAGERSRGTLPLLQALPADLRRLAVVKLSFALATVVAPILIALGLMFLMLLIGEALEWSYALEARRVLRRFSGGAITGNAVQDAVLMTSLFCVSIIGWIAALGVNRESEVRAGAIGLVVIVALWAVLVSAAYAIGEQRAEALTEWLGAERMKGVLQAAFAAMPGGIAAVPGISSVTYWSVAAPAFLLVHGALVVWYVLRFGRTENTNRWSAKPTAKGSTIAEWLDKPRSSPLTALAWKQLCESGPVVATGFAGAVGCATVTVYAQWASIEEQPEVMGHDWQYEVVASIVSAMLIGFGYLAGLITGVGASAGELQPKPLGFWRSRPIDIDLWFWSKCGVAVLMLLATFVLPSLLLWGFVMLGAPRLELPDNHLLIFALNGLGFLLAPMLLGFASALLAGCVLRHTVYAALLGLVASLGLIASFAIRVQNDYETAGMNAILLLIAVLMTLAAWLAVRCDWSLGK